MILLQHGTLMILQDGYNRFMILPLLYPNSLQMGSTLAHQYDNNLETVPYSSVTTSESSTKP